MKFRILTTLLFVLLFAASGNSYAGIFVKKHIPATDSISEGRAGLILERADAFREKVSNITLLNKPMPYGRSDNGWAGMVSFFCGIGGFLTVGITGIAAIIFGIVNLAGGKRKKGFAIAGIILGALSIAFWIIIFSVIASLATI